MDRVAEHTVSRTVRTLIAAFAGFLVLGTVFYDAAWVGHMYVVAWALLPFFAVAMWFITYFDGNVLVADEPDDSPDPLAVLRERYARGEIDESEFERRTERLLETNSPDERPSATAGTEKERTTRR